MRTVETCETCGKPTMVEVQVGGCTTTIKTMCDCLMQKHEAEEKAIKEQQENRRKEQRRIYTFGYNGLIPSFEKSETNNSLEECRKFVNHWGMMDRNGYGLLLFGATDQGKTHAALCIANELYGNNRVIMRTAPEIVSEMGKPFYERMMDCDLLIIDDLGAERTTSYGKEALYRVIDSRYKRCKPILATTNLSRQELMYPDDIEAQRAYARLLERCLPIEFENGYKRAKRENFEEMKRILEL